MRDIILHSGIFSEVMEVKRNTVLKPQSSIDTDIYYIEEGSLFIAIPDEGEERIVRFGYTGNLIASLDSFLTEKPSDFYIQTIKKTHIRKASKKEWYRIIHSDGQYQQWWIELLENLIIQQIEREQDLLIQSPKERYERVLRRSPKLFQEIPHKYIAKYLRMSAETLSRLEKS